MVPVFDVHVFYTIIRRNSTSKWNCPQDASVYSRHHHSFSSCEANQAPQHMTTGLVSCCRDERDVSILSRTVLLSLEISSLSSAQLPSSSDLLDLPTRLLSIGWWRGCQCACHTHPYGHQTHLKGNKNLYIRCWYIRFLMNPAYVSTFLYNYF